MPTGNIKERVIARLKTDRAFRTRFWKDAPLALREYKLSRLTLERVVGHVTCLQQKEIKATRRSGSVSPIIAAEPDVCCWTANCNPH